MLFRELGKIALEKGCGRIDWSVLDWNQPVRPLFSLKPSSSTL